MDLMSFDVDAMWRFRSDERLVPHLTFGHGYAQTDLDEPITGTVDGQPVSLDDDGGLTANLGGGFAWFMTEQFILRGDARYRYIDELVDNLEESVNSVETTVGIGWRF